MTERFPDATWAPVPCGLADHPDFLRYMSLVENTAGLWFKLSVFGELGLNSAGRRAARKNSICFRRFVLASGNNNSPGRTPRAHGKAAARASASSSPAPAAITRAASLAAGSAAATAALPCSARSICDTEQLVGLCIRRRWHFRFILAGVLMGRGHNFFAQAFSAKFQSFHAIASVGKLLERCFVLGRHVKLFLRSSHIGPGELPASSWDPTGVTHEIRLPCPQVPEREKQSWKWRRHCAAGARTAGKCSG